MSTIDIHAYHALSHEDALAAADELSCDLAEKFGIPVVTFIDTPGAYPGIDAEERGQAEAIAVNLREMARLQGAALANADALGHRHE